MTGYLHAFCLSRDKDDYPIEYYANVSIGIGKYRFVLTASERICPGNARLNTMNNVTITASKFLNI